MWNMTTAVSYTHLDVYKRQSLYLANSNMGDYLMDEQRKHSDQRLELLRHRKAESPYREGKARLVFSVADTLKSIGILAAASCVSYLFSRLGFADANIITVYVLAVLLVSVTTSNRAYGLIASVVSVLAFNFLFTNPRFSFVAYDSGYPVTCLLYTSRCV